MRSLTVLRLLSLLTFLSIAFSAAASLNPTSEIQDGQNGTLMHFPPRPTETGVKQIPDAAHPFIAPGPHDQRGPCPAMNTLANHGYVSRDGITNFEEITLALVEAFNLEYNLSSLLAALNILLSGNPFVNKISIGGVSPHVPPLPGKVGAPQTGGIAKHGGLEGDASLTRADSFIGDSRNFQDILYDLDLLGLGKFGDNGPDGNNTVFNVQTMTAIRLHNLVMDQAANPKFEFPLRRRVGALLEAAFFLDVFANGTTQQSTLPTIGSFFRNQTFPPNAWHRAARPVTLAKLGATVTQIQAGLGAWASGRNDDQGMYVLDPVVPAPFNSSNLCMLYYDVFAVIPAGLATKTTGIFKQNVDFLSKIVFDNLGGPDCDVMLEPFGPKPE